jgi:hypothetical protein
MKKNSWMTLVGRCAVLRSVGLAVLLLNGFTAQAQFDSTPRQNLHVGFEESLRDDGPYDGFEKLQRKSGVIL